MHVNERFKNKSKTKSRHIQIDDLAHKKCNGIIKGWRHCLTSNQKEDFLSINIVRTPQPYFFKKVGGAFEEKSFFFCHHNFMKKSHSKFSKNEPENIP